MGQVSMEKTVAPGSALSGNQQPDQDALQVLLQQGLLVHRLDIHNLGPEGLPNHRLHLAG
jgi:hypothetical protein